MRQCVYLEAQAIVDVKKDTLQNIQLHVNKYLELKYPQNNGLFATGVMIMNNKSIKMLEFFNTWLYEYQSSPSRRDQMSVNFALWKYQNDSNKILNLIQMDEHNMYWGSKFFLLNNHARLQNF